MIAKTNKIVKAWVPNKKDGYYKIIRTVGNVDLLVRDVKTKIDAITILKRRYRWQLTRIGDGYQMTRIEGNCIACRPLTLWEKIKYFRKVKEYGKIYQKTDYR